MSENVNVLIEKMNEESVQKRQQQTRQRKQAALTTNQNVAALSMAGGGASMDDGQSVGMDGASVSLNPAVGIGGGGPGGRHISGVSPSGARSYISAYHKTGAGVSLAEKEAVTMDKAIVNLLKEHNKLKKRLEMI